MQLENLSLVAKCGAVGGALGVGSELLSRWLQRPQAGAKGVFRNKTVDYPFLCTNPSMLEQLEQLERFLQICLSTHHAVVKQLALCCELLVGYEIATTANVSGHLDINYKVFEIAATLKEMLGQVQQIPYPIDSIRADVDIACDQLGQEISDSVYNINQNLAEKLSQSLH